MDVLAGSDEAGRWLEPGWWRPALASGHQHGRPPWAELAEQAIAAAAPSAEPPPGSWPEAFAAPLRPFCLQARDELAAGIGQLVPGAHAEPRQVADALTASLGRRLARIAVRTFMHELEAARADRRLVGASETDRFAGFLAQQSSPAALAALFARYPVLARLLSTASQVTVQAGLELMARFASDRTAIIDELLGGADPGPVVAAQPGLGDRHQGGRSVAAITFADGRKVIYKPRDLASYQFFRDVIGWLNERVPRCELRQARLVGRPGYGWLEYVRHQPLTRPDAAGSFYRRTGILLAALYVLRATDIHCENLIACGDQPVLIDAETIFHPALPIPGEGTVVPDPARQALAASAYRVALLPYPDVSDAGIADRSGLGGDPGQAGAGLVLDWDPPASDRSRLIWRPEAFAGAANRPVADGREIDLADHETAVLDGFQLGYAAIAAERHSFGRLIESGRGIEARVVARPTQEYARLLDESTAPDLLRDAHEHDRALALPGGEHRMWREIAEAELADLRAGDIPLLTTRPGTADLFTSARQRLPGLLDRTGLHDALMMLKSMDEVDLRDQAWVISASLATHRPADGHASGPPMPGHLTAIAAEPTKLLLAACGLADQIVARGMADPAEPGRHRTNWIGLQLVDDARWMVLPMGASLTDGYVGVGLFLAQLASLTGIARYAEAAGRAMSPVSPLLDAIAGQPDLLAAIGCGMNGLGGISYGLARMAVLLDDSELAKCAEQAVRVTATAAGVPCPPWWMNGRSGCLAAMAAVRAELGSAAAGALARACAGELASEVSASGLGEPDSEIGVGFARGRAGVGVALARFGAVEADPAFFGAGQDVLRRACESGAVFSASAAGGDGWCTGAAGLLIARACLAGVSPAGLRSAAEALASRPVLRDLSPCHGQLGVVDALVAAGKSVGSDDAGAWFRRSGGLILDAIRHHGRYCGTPGGVETPGLLSGLAGVGYGLLRLAFPERVPSVLLLEAAGHAAGPAQFAPPGQPRFTRRSQRCAKNSSAPAPTTAASPTSNLGHGASTAAPGCDPPLPSA